MKSSTFLNPSLRQVGIWLDFKNANIITLMGEDVRFETLSSEIDPGKFKGGHRSKTPYGPMDKVSETRHLEKKKHQHEAYFERICTEVKDCDELFIMGPAEAKIGLRKYLSEHRELYAKLRDVQTADSLTDNQKIKIVKDFFAV